MHDIKVALKSAFPHTLPIFTGFIFLGIAFGILMETNGFSIGWTLFLSAITFAGGMQFLTVSLLTMQFAPFYVFMLTLMVNARHLFYGISMLDKFRNTKKFKPFLIFSLCDETFSILCSSKPENNIDRTWFMFWIAFLDYVYWIIGSLLGAVLGQYITINTEGLDFVLTALFVVILIEQWKSLNHHYAPIIGVACTLLSLLLVGPDKCIIVSMGMIILIMAVLQKKMPLKDIL